MICTFTVAEYRIGIDYKRGLRKIRCGKFMTVIVFWHSIRIRNNGRRTGVCRLINGALVLVFYICQALLALAIFLFNCKLNNYNLLCDKQKNSNEIENSNKQKKKKKKEENSTDFCFGQFACPQR